ncbi:chorismate-binding protein [Glycomyces endophyticus]
MSHRIVPVHVGRSSNVHREHIQTNRTLQIEAVLRQDTGGNPRLLGAARASVFTAREVVREEPAGRLSFGGRQSYERAFTDSPSALYERVLAANPAPYAAHLNLGRAEHLVIVSPELFVRSRGRRIESAPIAGTAARGANAIEDFQILRDLLLSDKADSELVMCTDVDRNDKSLVCEPGSVQVIAHRDVETTPRLMHTVEHITGTLRDGYSALDAFISHMWAVTVTGAPKIGAMQFIEATETSARGWYAGAFGAFLCNGDMDFGITIRAVHLVDGMARVRAGNSLLARSVTAYEEAECALKAAALLDAIDQHPGGPDLEVPPDPPTPQGLRVLIVDHEDSFVHTLADYFRRAGCDTTTIRSDRGTGIAEAFLDQASPDLIVLSPGPGSPGEFGTGRVLAYATSRRIPVFGVCLGMQAIGEYLGAELKPLPAPAHGVRSAVSRIDASESNRLAADGPRGLDAAS